MKFINTTGVFCARTEMYSISKISFLDNRQKIDLFNKFAMGGWIQFPDYIYLLIQKQ